MSRITKMFTLPLLISVMFVSFSAVIFAGKALAAEVYKGPCKSTDGNIQLDVPFKKNGNSYDCVRNLNNGDSVSGPVDCKIPGIGEFAGWDTKIAGWACLVPDKVTVGSRNDETPQFAKSDCNSQTIDANNCGIIKYLTIFINVLSAMVGVVVVIMIIVGGIQYSSAGDDPQKVSAAKTRITNALLALFVFIFMYALLQWLVPGGVF